MYVVIKYFVLIDNVHTVFYVLTYDEREYLYYQLVRLCIQWNNA